jgi:hypothetical protein
MMKGQLIAILLMAATPSLAQAPAAPEGTPKYSVQTTTMGEMVANPQTKLCWKSISQRSSTIRNSMRVWA